MTAERSYQFTSSIPPAKPVAVDTPGVRAAARPRAQVYWFHPDHLGTGTLITDLEGRPHQFFLNLPYGETFIEQGGHTYDNPYKFNGKELDEETGLYYYGARYYDPKISLWLSVDPLAGEYPGISPFAYTYGNPVRFVDPTGMEGEAWDDWYKNKNTGELIWLPVDEKTGHTFKDENGEIWENIGDELLFFDGSNLVYFTQEKIQGKLQLKSYLFKAVSGRPLPNGEFDYSKTRQAQKNVGPIPEGDYKIYPNQIQRYDELSSFQKLASLLERGKWPGGTVAWGNERVWINPPKVKVVNPENNQIVERTNMSIHGGKIPGSAGCIDLYQYAPDFFKKLKKSTSPFIFLRVQYPKTNQ